MTQLKALIFDVDGTLAETERDGHRVAFNRAFTECGLDWHWDEDLYGKLLAVTGGKERICFYLEQFLNKVISPELEDLIVQLHAAKTGHYTDILQSHVISLRPGIERLINEARRSDIQLAIATTTTPANVDALLMSTLGEESLSWFTTIAAGDVVPEKKPASDIFNYCLEQLALPAEACLAIEDSENGLKASLGAGIQTIVTCNSYTQKENFTGALSVFNHLGEPDEACECLAGITVDKPYISLNELKVLHEKAHN